MKRLDQKIYVLRLTDEEARALLALFFEQCPSRALGRVCRRLEKIMQQIGDEK